MTNAVYPLYKQSIMTEADANNGLNTTGSNGTFCALVNISTYTYNAGHQFYSSLSGQVGTDQEITTPTVVQGTFDGDDITYTAVTGAAVGAVVLFRKNAGANTTWRLVIYEDTSFTGLPVTPNGGNIIVTWNASGIFTISDERMKENIVELGELGSLPFYEFNYKGSDERSRGFLAHEVARYHPDAVREFSGILTVNYSKVIERWL